jgi:hypothetical protein
MTKITMTRTAFIKEHEDLLKVLKSGDKKGLNKEYKEQSSELKKYLNKKMFNKK